MYDKGKILTGLVIFLILILFPVWYNAANGKATAPDPKLPPGGGNCVMATDYMKAYHMDLLNTWRDEVVREGSRVHVAPDGKKYEKSLTNTCMQCHTSKAEFCDQCHNYVGVKPYCWDCHINPEDFK